MGVPSKQIGWSQEAILLHAVSKQLQRLQGIIAASSGGGGGGSQDLQSVLDISSHAEVDGGKSTVDILTGDVDNRSFSVYLTSSDEPASNYESGFTIDKTSYQLTKEFEGKYSSIQLDYGDIRFSKQSDYVEGSGYTNTYQVLVPDATASTVTINFPTKSTGDYVLATIADVYDIINGTFPVYANDAAADADVALLSGSLYKITGNRQIFQKP